MRLTAVEQAENRRRELRKARLLGSEQLQRENRERSDRQRSCGSALGDEGPHHQPNAAQGGERCC